ncbi:HAMP domain-containing histidine kinase [Halomonas sp. MCCC 1A17488]|uniref:sensor histidine kinase n=1 Tax=unclassified Halomonas TaxID=2609666 RepID=UPI0018D2719A|nr:MULTISPECIES: HAMP domain-containing sensor histidine kinase [unclassified Halomonas]MCE8016565.1 HAMP domain-containing histidine kinase [Halomonas sp. MCCC 1A17488]MCG3239898.1 HAMP domain-containing histidine kinase [Halomonas sp. MCCC 1A17488]QPP50208.1 HAMP domain-containing histidine kinase [Halomonas sp. SS10-MC5]
MRGLLRRCGRLGRSLYARIALVYLSSLLLLSVATAWIAISQFNQLTRELQQRMEIDLAKNLAQVMQPALWQGAGSDAARDMARHILSINPSLSLYVLDEQGRVIADYAEPACGLGRRIEIGALETLLSEEPMLPVLATAPCGSEPGIFSVAPIQHGEARRQGFLYVDLANAGQASMFSMLRTSSITRTLVAAGLMALLVSGVFGLVWFALLTRRFSRLTTAVQRFANGVYGQRIATPRDDELGRLARAFNDMAGTIEAQLQAMRETDRQRRELVANLSHDFRTPLTSLRGYTEQLLAAETADEGRRRMLTAILDNADRLTRLAQQLSTLARLDADDRPLQCEPFSLAELAHDIVGKFQHQARTAGISLTVACEPSLPRVEADLGLTDRLLSNLIDNALRATPAGGWVRLDAEALPEGVRLAVIDNGVGIPEEELPLVTQRFYRTRASLDRGDGSGLGLSIVREICERQGVAWKIASAPGKGTEVSVILPRA